MCHWLRSSLYTLTCRATSSALSLRPPQNGRLSSPRTSQRCFSIPSVVCDMLLTSTLTAQTSITIDDIVYVIDAGKVKETQYDPESGLTKLVEQWITRAAGRQRRGRAGRTRPGVCYKLYTRWRENKMEQFPRPEILRVPLESICLAVKATREDEDVKVCSGGPATSAAVF